MDLLWDIGCLHLTTLLGEDGKDDHCVAVTETWIFDSNFEHALPRSRASLDMCCSSDDVSSRFVSAISIAIFHKITMKHEI